MEMHLIEISLAPTFAALFATLFYFVYLKASGVEVSDSYVLETIFLVIVISFVLGLAVNELLLWRAGERFRVKRLIFRWTLTALYILLIGGVYTFLLALLPSMSTSHAILVSAVMATWIFIAVALKKKNLLSRLDRAD